MDFNVNLTSHDFLKNIFLNVYNNLKLNKSQKRYNFRGNVNCSNGYSERWVGKQDYLESNKIIFVSQ